MKLVKEIKSQKGAVHFRRYSILQLPFFAIYVHQILKADEDRHLHNHPWHLLSFVLKGGYVEEVKCKSPVGKKRCTRARHTVALRMRKKFHRIWVLPEETWTLNFVFGVKQAWGYDVRGQFIPHDKYRKMKREGKL